MKHLLIAVLLSACQSLSAQNIQDLVFKQDLYKVNARIDSLNHALRGGGTTNPPNDLPKCKRGPKPEGVSSITTASSIVLWDGEDVKGWDYSIYRGAERVAFGSVKPTGNKEPITYPGLSPGTYRLSMTGNTCKSDVYSIDFVVPEPTGGNPPPVFEARSLGAYSTTVGGRTYTYNKTPELELQFNQDGTFSDVTAGLDHTRKPNKLDGKNVFYMVGYSVHRNSDGSYADMQNVYLPDGVYSIRQFICNPGRLRNTEAFEAGINGWGENGVNDQNARFSEIFLSITSNQKQGNGIVPAWLRVSRNLNFPKSLPEMDWRPYNRSFSTGYINRGDAQAVYQRVGVQPYVEIGNMTPQSNVWHTTMVGRDVILNNDQLYDLGRHWMQRLGSDQYSVLTSELAENSAGKDPDIYGRTQRFYAGAFDVLKEKGISDPLQTGLFGDYGGDGFYGFFDGGILFGPRSEYEESLTSHLYSGHGINGFSSRDHEYYTRDHIGVRNLNEKYYFWNHVYHLPYEFLYTNEKAKLGTKTWQGVDRERKVSIFSMDKVESFVERPSGGKINIEQARTGEIIPFQNGEILTKMNSQPPVPWDEMFTAGFWSMLLTGGIEIWDAPGSSFGTDTTKIHWWSDQFIGWRKKGESGFSAYSAGQNGAPENSNIGLTNSLFASPVDACAAGMSALWDIRNRIQSLSHASYISSRGAFTAKPGSAGLTLNGFGPVNRSLFVVMDAIDQKKGLALIGEGSEGKVAIYYNGFLPAHEFEDNVTIDGINLGRCYGRQTYYKKY